MVLLPKTCETKWKKKITIEHDHWTKFTFQKYNPLTWKIVTKLTITAP